MTKNEFLKIYVAATKNWDYMAKKYGSDRGKNLSPEASKALMAPEKSGIFAGQNSVR